MTDQSGSAKEPNRLAVIVVQMVKVTGQAKYK